eukprot:CAMPEP_0205923684 /NCGR_PEP_ID=MMETSP1325-20131115/16545_1 /ASSEMBLY_ACC=CAM_ASM_000708 /TAXON_ID=236786 /ORGANISM="Florenciella sp., Strain RCC1007" /LENGTH=40 /DNA_ID= /DNA_START= /DNA_END= /DNA_ORIENTATION=
MSRTSSSSSSSCKCFGRPRSVLISSAVANASRSSASPGAS